MTYTSVQWISFYTYEHGIQTQEQDAFNKVVK